MLQRTKKRCAHENQGLYDFPATLGAGWKKVSFLALLAFLGPGKSI